MKSNAPEFLANVAEAMYEEDPRFFDLMQKDPAAAIVHSLFRYAFPPFYEASMKTLRLRDAFLRALPIITSNGKKVGELQISTELADDIKLGGGLGDEPERSEWDYDE